MEILDNIIDDLKNDKLVLDQRRNQQGQNVVTKSLSINEEGQFQLFTVNCKSSSIYGFGTCHCSTHSASTEKTIIAIEGLRTIQDYIRKQKVEQEMKEKDIKRVDMILECLEELNFKFREKDDELTIGDLVGNIFDE